MWISASDSALITKSEAGAEQTECQHQMRSGSGCGGPYIYRGRSCGGASWRPMHMPVGQPHGNCVSVIPIRLPEPRCIVCHVKHCHLSKVDARGSPGKQLVLVVKLSLSIIWKSNSPFLHRSFINFFLLPF